MPHKFLQNLSRKHGVDMDGISPNLKTFIEAIGASYEYFEKDRKLLERSIELSSAEMIELNRSLKEKNQEMRHLFNNLGEVMFSMDMVDYKIIQISAACEKLFGYTAQEFYTDANIFSKTMYPEDYHLLYQYSSLPVNGKSQVEIQCRIVRKDGVVRWIESSSTPTIDSEGKVVRVDGVARDITDRKIAEDALKQSEREFREFFESAPEAIAIIDADTGKFVDFNSNTLRLFRFSAAEMLRKSPIDLSIPRQSDGRDSYTIFKEVIDLVMEGKTPVFEWGHCDSQGRIFPCEIRLTRLSVPGKNLFRASIVDISEKKVAEQKLNDSLQEISRILNNINDAFFSLNMLTYKYIFISPACEKIYGYSAEDFLAHVMLWKDVIHPDDAHLANLHDERLYRGERINLLYRIIHKGGSIRWVEVKLIPTLDEKRKLVRVDTVINDVTEKHKAEKQILESADRLNRAQKVAGLGSWELEFPNGNAIWSDEACNLYGLPLSDNRQTYEQWLSFIHPEDLALVLAENKKAQDSLSFSQFDHRIIRKDGVLRYIHSECYYTFDESGRPIGLHGIAHDITEKRKTEQLMQLQFNTVNLLSNSNTIQEFASKALKVICEGIGWLYAGLWMVKNEHTLYYADSWNIECSNLLAFAETSKKYNFPLNSGLPGRVWNNQKPEWIEDVCLDVDFLRKDIAEKANLHGAFAFPLQHDGKVMGVLEVFSSESKEPDQAILLMLDIIGPQISQFIARKIAEESLRQSEASLRTIFDTADAGFLLMDTHYNVIASNEMIEQWSMDSFGVPLIAGANLRNLLVSEKREELDTMMASVLEGRSINYETEYPGLNGAIRWLHINAKPVLNEVKTTIGLCLVISNITLRKNAEMEVLSLNSSLEEKVEKRTAELEIANKELEAFSYSVSHDLRAPLRIINGYAKILLKIQKDKLDKQGQEDLQSIMDNAVHMGNLIDDLLNFSRLGRASLAKNTMNMTDMVKVVIEEVKASNPCKAEIKLKDFQSTSCDPRLMKQVWVNLISNAVKYSRKRDKPIIEIGSTGKNGHQVYYVKDNGAGFDMQHSNKLFGVFQRLHKVSEFEGTGVGLALVQRIVTKHGGKIWAEAKIDEGATFYFTLPTA